MINTELKKRILSSLFLIPITLFFIFQNNFFFIFFLSIIFLVSSYEWIKMNKKDLIKIVGIYYLFFCFFYGIFFKRQFSLGIFILILIICIFTDLGGLYIG